MTVGNITFKGSVARDIDRMIGRILPIDKALKARFPGAQHEMGEVMTRIARQYVQVKSGQARAGIGFRVANTRLYFGIKGVDHAAALNFGFKGRALVKSHSRMQTSVLGRMLDAPVKVTVGAHVRQGNMPARPFIFRAYFDSFRAMYGIMNRIISEAQKEVGFDG